MGIFDIFRKKNVKAPSNNVPNVSGKMWDGPTFLESCTVSINSREKLEPFEWKRKLQSPTGGDKFRIRYYGQLYKDASGLLIGTGFAPLLVVAVDVETNDELLLFDGCRHGYNAMFCDTYSEQQRNGRIAEKY